MLFNVLSCILIWFIGSLVFYTIFEKVEPKKEDNYPTSKVGGTIITIIFMWLMSWQNWWR